MNTISNVAVLTIGIGALGTVVEFLRAGQVTEAIVAGVVGLAALVIYERLPLSVPPAQ